MHLLICLLLSHLCFYCNAWSFVNDAASSSRRSFFQSGTQSTVAAVLTSVAISPLQQAVAASKTDGLIEELQSQKEKLEPIAQLLAQEEWDKVRQILKSPPVNKLWELADVRIYSYEHKS